jgi:hypothetical protein
MVGLDWEPIYTIAPFGRSKPSVGVEVAPVFEALHNSERAGWQRRSTLWQTQDPDIVTTCCQHERDGRVGQETNLENRAPRRDVITFGAHCKNRRADIRECDGSSTGSITPFG